MEVPLDAGWVLAYRIVKREDRLVVAEGRVFPDERGRDSKGRKRTPGAWSGKAASVPVNGIPGEALKELRLNDPRQVLPRVRQNLINRYGKKRAQGILQDLFAGTTLSLPLGGANPGRQKLTDLELAELARDYVALADAGVIDVIVQLAEKWSMSQDGIHSRRRAAIRRDILSPGDSSLGRANGRLTPKGKRILEATK